MGWRIVFRSVPGHKIDVNLNFNVTTGYGGFLCLAECFDDLWLSVLDAAVWLQILLSVCCFL